MRFPHVPAVSVLITLLAFPLVAQSPNGAINGRKRTPMAVWTGV